MLRIYLNDHLAGATAARELARRAAASNRESSYGRFFDALALQIDEDRDSLLEIMGALGVRIDRVKVKAAWGAEKLGRLKLNGRLFGYSPLSRLVELEGLALAVHGKSALWRVLRDMEPTEEWLAKFDLETLIVRAERQRDELEVQRLRAASEAFA